MSVTKKAYKNKEKLAKKFAHDPDAEYSLRAETNPYLGPVFGVKNVIISGTGEKIDPKKGILIGTIRMGFGHYRMSMAIASAVKAMGYTPYWFDLLAYETTGKKVIRHLEALYNMGSRWSQKYKLFNKFVWEPVTAFSMKKISYNASDRAMCELFSDVYADLPKDMPIITTHSWPAQAALHAGMKNVVHVVCDNWPMSLHFAEGAVHTVQTPSAYFGYRVLRGMGIKKNDVLKPMPADSLVYTGHYVDHEIVANIEGDCKKRLARMKKKEPRRILMSIGGAGAQQETFKAIIKFLLPKIKDGEVALLLNLGDHRNAWESLKGEFAGYEDLLTTHFDWDDSSKFAKEALSKQVTGIHYFLHDNTFTAVYITNLLMRAADCLMTKPSELAFYPVPKIFIKRVGGHEMWGAVRGAEVGDSTVECDTTENTLQALDLFISEDTLLQMYCDNIMKNNKIGIYDGAYKAVEIAVKMKGKKK
ncbi:MAG: DUF6938 domain-containing protein [Spirochaetota bacterium]